MIKPKSAIPARPAAAPALPAGPVRGAAADPGAVPRDAGARVLRRPELLGRAHRPERHRRRTSSSQPPYYLTLTMPGQPQPEFSLITSLTPRGRPNMAAFMEVNSNPLSPGYGTIRILQLPQDTTIRGPAAGAERLRVQRDRGLGAEPAAQGRIQGDPGQPDHPAGGRRPAVFRAGLRVQSPTGSSGAYPTLQERARLLQRPGRVREPRCSGRWRRCSATGRPAQPGAARRHRQPGHVERGRAEGPAAGREVLQPGAGGAEERQPDRFTAQRHGQDEGGAGPGAAAARGSAVSRQPSPSPSAVASPSPACPQRCVRRWPCGSGCAGGSGRPESSGTAVAARTRRRRRGRTLGSDGTSRAKLACWRSRHAPGRPGERSLTGRGASCAR